MSVKVTAAKVTRENIWFSSRSSIDLILIYEVQIVINFSPNPELKTIKTYKYISLKQFCKNSYFLNSNTTDKRILEPESLVLC
jgi:hypothetical protein